MASRKFKIVSAINVWLKQYREGIEGLQMCVRTLKRRLRSLGLKRKDNAKVMDDSVIREEMRGPVRI